MAGPARGGAGAARAARPLGGARGDHGHERRRPQGARGGHRQPGRDLRGARPHHARGPVPRPLLRRVRPVLRRSLRDRGPGGLPGPGEGAGRRGHQDPRVRGPGRGHPRWPHAGPAARGRAQGPRRRRTRGRGHRAGQGRQPRGRQEPHPVAGRRVHRGAPARPAGAGRVEGEGGRTRAARDVRGCASVDEPRRGRRGRGLLSQQSAHDRAARHYARDGDGVR